MSKTKWYAKPLCHCERSVAILIALALVLSLGIVALPMAGTVEAKVLEITNIEMGTWTHIDTGEDERYIEAVKGENILFWHNGTQLRRTTYTWDGTAVTLGTATSPTGLTYNSGANDPHHVFRTPTILNNGGGNLEGYFQPRGGTANGVFHATSTDNGATWTVDAVLAGFDGSGTSLNGSILLPNDDVGWVYNPDNAAGGVQVSGINAVIESGGERRIYGENSFGDVMLWTSTAGNNGPFTRTGVLIDNHTDGSPVMENVAPSGDAIMLGTGEVVFFYVDGNFWKPWDNEANEGAVGTLVLNAAGDGFTQQVHDFVRVGDAGLVAADLTALEEATVSNINFNSNQMSFLLILIGANDGPSTWGTYGGTPDPRTSTDHDIFYAPVTITFNQVVAPPPTEVWVDDDWAGLSPGDPADGHIFGYDAFATIQDGIDAVAGSTVHVAAGTYTEHVTIDKSLALQGAGASQTTIDVSGLLIQNPHVAVEVQNGVNNVVVDGFTIIGVPAFHHSDDSVIRCGGSSGTNNDITISNNVIDGNRGILFKNGDSLTVQQNDITFNKNAIVIQSGCTNVDISDNTMTGGTSMDTDPYGIYITSTTGSITGNTIENVIGPDDRGKGISGSSNHDLVIDDNVINNTGYDGISFWSNTHHVTISNNTLSNNAQTYTEGGGITIKGDDLTIINNNITGSGHDGVIIDTHVLTSVRIDINYNNIWGNADYGVNVKHAGEIVDATCNWWGDASGPEDPDGTTEVPPCTDDPANEKNADGQGDAVSDNVDYCPWLISSWPYVEFAQFTIDHAKIDFKKKADDDKVRVKGKLALDLDNGNGVDISEDVIVTVGSFSETIPGGTMVEKKSGKWEYKRPKGESGIKHMKIHWKDGEAKFDIRVDKADLGDILAWTNPVTISVQIGDDIGSADIEMREKKHHWDYKAPHD